MILHDDPHVRLIKRRPRGIGKPPLHVLGVIDVRVLITEATAPSLALRRQRSGDVTTVAHCSDGHKTVNRGK